MLTCKYINEHLPDVITILVMRYVQTPIPKHMDERQQQEMWAYIGSRGEYERCMDVQKEGWHYVIMGAAHAGEYPIVKLMIDKGCKEYQEALEQASRNNHLNIVKLLAPLCTYKRDAFYYACLHGYRDMVDYLMSIGVNEWDAGLTGACYGQQHDMQQLMIQKGATRCYRCDNDVYSTH